MDTNFRRLIPLACVLGLTIVAGCSGDTASDPEGVLGVREGGQGTTMRGSTVEALCSAMLDCVPVADRGGATVGACVEVAGPYFDDLFAGAPAACAGAFDAYLTCLASNAQCGPEGDIDPSGACAAEEAAGAAACEGYEPDVNVEDYIQVSEVIDEQTSSDSL